MVTAVDGFPGQVANPGRVTAAKATATAVSPNTTWGPRNRSPMASPLLQACSVTSTCSSVSVGDGIPNAGSNTTSTRFAPTGNATSGSQVGSQPMNTHPEAVLSTRAVVIWPGSRPSS